MIGSRVENMTGMITLSYIAAWLATFGGTAAGYFYYPWAYPTNSGHYAFIVLTIIEAIGYLFCVKVMEEGTKKEQQWYNCRSNWSNCRNNGIHIVKCRILRNVNPSYFFHFSISYYIQRSIIF